MLALRCWRRGRCGFASAPASAQGHFDAVGVDFGFAPRRVPTEQLRHALRDRFGGVQALIEVAEEDLRSAYEHVGQRCGDGRPDARLRPGRGQRGKADRRRGGHRDPDGVHGVPSWGVV